MEQQDTKVCNACEKRKALALFPSTGKGNKRGARCGRCNKGGWSKSLSRSAARDKEVARGESWGRRMAQERADAATDAVCARLATTTAEALGR